MAKKMAKRSRPRLSRPNAVSPTPTPVYSTFNTPSSSALPSAYASEDEDDAQPAKFDVSTIPIQNLSLGASMPKKTQSPSAADDEAVVLTGETLNTTNTEKGTGKEPKQPFKPFRFLNLPSELRVKIYGYHFEGADLVADLTPENFKKLYKKLFLLRTCRKVYMEASYFYYSTHTFRIFPTYPGRFFKTRRPLLARLTKNQRATMTTMELRLGPGFNKPPKCWTVNKALGLKDCVNVRQLNVFVQLDPSVSWLDGFRKPGFYEAFSRNLLDGILKEAPSVEVVEFDAYESVRKNCPIMEALQETTRDHGKRITWGPKNGWTATGDNPDNSANDASAAKNASGIGNLALGGGGGSAILNYDNPIAAVA